MKKSYLIYLSGLFLSTILIAEESGHYAYSYGRYKEPQKDSCEAPSARDERKLISEINSESRRLYNSLDCEGKNLAIELSKRECSGQCTQDNYCCFPDKNLAVQEATKKMAKRRAHLDREQRAKRHGTDEYNGRYGY